MATAFFVAPKITKGFLFRFVPSFIFTRGRRRWPVTRNNWNIFRTWPTTRLNRSKRRTMGTIATLSPKSSSHYSSRPSRIASLTPPSPYRGQSTPPVFAPLACAIDYLTRYHWCCWVDTFPMRKRHSWRENSIASSNRYRPRKSIEKKRRHQNASTICCRRFRAMQRQLK